MSERVEVDGNKMTIIRTEDVQPVLDRAAALRSMGVTGFSENWHIGSVPTIIFEQWLKEAGLRMSDTKAVKDMLERKLMDGDFAKFRVHGGTFR
jgi:hypothetical protein